MKPKKNTPPNETKHKKSKSGESMSYTTGSFEQISAKSWILKFHFFNVLRAGFEEISENILEIVGFFGSFRDEKK